MIRGVPSPVVDVARILGAPSTPETWKRFVSLRVGKRIVALAVDEVVGLQTLDTVQFHTLPPLLEDASQTVGRLGELDGELLLILREAHLLPDSAWEEAMA